jgi:hypothetical protein
MAEGSSEGSAEGVEEEERTVDGEDVGDTLGCSDG